MAKPVPAPKPSNQNFLFVSYIYAACTAALVLYQLIGFGGFDFGPIAFAVHGDTFSVLSLTFLQIFSLPFALRFSLSPLARFCSAALCLITPLLFLTYKLYNLIGMFGLVDFIIALALLTLGLASFMVLDGKKAVDRLKA